jgi:hypothetical protein
MQKIKPYRSYLILIIAFALLGMLFSFGAQRGGINQFNGFIAPIIGPWSRVLPPNADKFKYWELNNYIFAISITVITLTLVAVSGIPKNKIVRILTKLISYIAVVFWCLCGMFKVILEMT